MKDKGALSIIIAEKLAGKRGKGKGKGECPMSEDGDKAPKSNKYSDMAEEMRVALNDNDDASFAAALKSFVKVCMSDSGEEEGEDTVDDDSYDEE